MRRQGEAKQVNLGGRERERKRKRVRVRGKKCTSVWNRWETWQGFFPARWPEVKCVSCIIHGLTVSLFVLCSRRMQHAKWWLIFSHSLSLTHIESKRGAIHYSSLHLMKQLATSKVNEILFHLHSWLVNEKFFKRSSSHWSSETLIINPLTFNGSVSLHERVCWWAELSKAERFVVMKKKIRIRGCRASWQSSSIISPSQTLTAVNTDEHLQMRWVSPWTSVRNV